LSLPVTVTLPRCLQRRLESASDRTDRKSESESATRAFQDAKQEDEANRLLILLSLYQFRAELISKK
jgi:hypothetical protein